MRTPKGAPKLASPKGILGTGGGKKGGPIGRFKIGEKSKSKKQREVFG